MTEKQLIKAMSRGELSALEELIAQYTPQRELFVRHYYYGQTVQEAALAMGVNLSTAKTWLRRGRETLKTILKKEGYGHEAADNFQAHG